MALQQGPAAVAVHDTVAAIAREPAYDRSLGNSAWRDFWDAFVRLLHRISEFFRGSAAGRHVTEVVVALIVVGIIVHFIISAIAARNTDAPGTARAGGSRAADAWSEAERLAAAGASTDAAHALLAALLAGFARRGEVRLHSSKTAGDYARELARRGSPARSAFQQFRRRYDAVIFGTGACTVSDYAELLRDATPMLSRGAMS